MKTKITANGYSALPEGIKALRRLTGAAAVCTAAMFASCNDAGTDAQKNNNVVMSLGGMTRAATDNTQVYVFEGTGTDRNFHHRVLQINRTTDGNGTGQLTMSMPEGTWDLALVGTADGTGAPAFLLPTAGRPRAAQKMFELVPTGDVLPQAPELVMARVDGKRIEPNVLNEAQTSFIRNVGMVRLTIKEPGGLSTTAVQKVSIGNVPTTLDWNGHLMRGSVVDKAIPSVSAARMQGAFTIAESGGVQSCSTVDFLVPAHLGNDVMASQPTDFSPNLLDVKVELTMTGGTVYTSTKTIPVAPLANKILQVNLIIGGELDVESDILEWEERDTEDIDIKGNPLSELRVGKTRFDLLGAVNNPASSDDMTVTAASGGSPVRPGIAIAPGAGSVPPPPSLDNAPMNHPWIRPLWGTGANATTLTVRGDDDNYDGSPRASEIYLVVNNLRKKIPVTQGHIGTNTITLGVPRIVFTPAPNGETEQVTVETTDNTGWRISRGFLKTYDDYGNRGEIENATITGALDGIDGDSFQIHSKFFPNMVDTGDYDIFENDTLRLHNTTTLEVAKIAVHNVYMTEDVTIGVDIPNGGASARATYTIRDDSGIEVYGGTRRFTVDQTTLPVWIESASCVENTDPATKEAKPWVLQLTVKGEGPNDEWEAADITIRNYDDPTYTAAVTINPGLVAVIPPFNYFVIRHEWYTARTDSSDDLDIGFRFYDVDNSIPPTIEPPFYDEAVGWQTQGNGRYAVAILNDGTSYQMVPARNADTYGYHWANNSANNPLPAGKTPVIEWNGDGAGGRGSRLRYETVFFNAPIVDAMTSLPRKLKMEVRAVWYAGTAGNPMRVSISAYQGGTMTPLTNYDYQNIGGTDLTPLMGDINNNNIRRVANRNQNRNFNTICVITYDRMLHTARLEWIAAAGTDPGFPPYTTGRMMPVPTTLVEPAEKGFEK